MPYLRILVPGLLTLFGFVGMVELLSFLTIGMAEGKRLSLFGHAIDAISATPWVVSLVCLVGGGILLAIESRHFFFFSSRRRHTRCGRDWSSDVCSSDLVSSRSSWRWNRQGRRRQAAGAPCGRVGSDSAARAAATATALLAVALPRLVGRGGLRSEERRVGKEGRARGWRDG